MTELEKQKLHYETLIENLKKQHKAVCDQYDSNERKHNARIIELQDALRALKKKMPKIKPASYKVMETRLTKAYDSYLKNHDEKSKIEMDIILFCLGYKTIEEFMEAKHYVWE